MPATALALALGAAFLHAFWNILLARAPDIEAATAVALVVGVVAFAPVAALAWEAEREVWPFLVVTSLLQLTYFALLTTAYRRAELSFVYPIARGSAPVLVLLGGIALLGEAASAAQVGGVLLVALRRPPRPWDTRAGGVRRPGARPRDRRLHRGVHAPRPARSRVRVADRLPGAVDDPGGDRVPRLRAGAPRRDPS